MARPFASHTMCACPPRTAAPGMKVRLQDVMVKTADGLVLNHASVGKWGFQVATVELVIKPAP